MVVVGVNHRQAPIEVREKSNAAHVVGAEFPGLDVVVVGCKGGATNEFRYRGLRCWRGPQPLGVASVIGHRAGCAFPDGRAARRRCDHASAAEQDLPSSENAHFGFLRGSRSLGALGSLTTGRKTLTRWQGKIGPLAPGAFK